LTLKFKCDENLPVEAAGLLTQAGHDAVTVTDQRMGGRPDPDVANVCQREGRTLVTLDLDFSDIRVYSPIDYSGIIVLRLSRLDKRRVLAVLQRLLPILDQEPLAGKLWIVDETTVRVRS
jgi:predicted nuclease of predicted toxin-antitoxin system